MGESPYHDFVPLDQGPVPPQTFPENNRENNSPLLKVLQLVNLLGKILLDEAVNSNLLFYSFYFILS